MHIHTGNHLLDLDVPGLPNEVRDEVLRQWQRLHENRRRWETLRWPTSYDPNEPQYGIRRANAADKEEKHKVVIHQLWRRCEFVGAVMLWNHIHKLRTSALEELRKQVVGLHPLLAGRPDDDPLVSCCTALWCEMNRYRYPGTQESPLPLLESVKDLSKDRLLYSVRKVYEAINTGKAEFWKTFHPWRLWIIPLTDRYSQADRTLAELMERWNDWQHTYNEAVRLYHQANSNLSQPHYNEQVEAAHLAGDDAAVEQAEHALEEAECIYIAAVEQLNRWRGKFLHFRAEITDALDAAVKIQRGNSPYDFTAMINCIYAKGTLHHWFRDHEERYEKLLPGIKTLGSKPLDYLARMARAA
jgi:hypothetical protein